ncbi:MAG: D-alanyl-D-alanine carboxypeptidase/D-alanyl-D-alanine-endopeptidase [Pseudomonadota bacterium]
MRVKRRRFLTGLAASLPLAVEARDLGGLRPRLRGSVSGPPVDRAAEVVGQSGLAGQTSYALIDIGTGAVLETHRPTVSLPPASVTKAVTALYGRAALGANYRFSTMVAATGPVRDGRIQGDLYLIGGGDPLLDTDGLADLIADLAARGVHGITGNAYVVGDALPYHQSIEPGQPVHVAYNPAISGLNLNFNRVYFEWKPGSDGPLITMTARGARHDPPVGGVEMVVVDRAGPIFAHVLDGDRDVWSVSRAALGTGEGARWLPVRAPDLYAADVFRTLAYTENIRLPRFRRARSVPAAPDVLAVRRSPTLDSLLRGMLKHSTNLTAEVVGLRAHQARGGNPDSIAASGAEMGAWAGMAHGLAPQSYRNHSGLTDATRVGALDMARLLAAAAPGPLEAMMTRVAVVDAEGSDSGFRDTVVRAKTGTLYFARGLAGYIACANGRRLAFAVFAADLDARRSMDQRNERPRGAHAWRNRARIQERGLLRAWVERHGMV